MFPIFLNNEGQVSWATLRFRVAEGSKENGKGVGAHGLDQEYFDR